MGDRYPTFVGYVSPGVGGFAMALDSWRTTPSKCPQRTHDPWLQCGILEWIDSPHRGFTILSDLSGSNSDWGRGM